MNPAPLALLGIALALGVDSFRSTLALGLLRPQLGQSLVLAASFAIVEATALAIGAGLGAMFLPIGGPWTQLITPILLAAMGLYVLLGARGEGRQQIAASPALWIGLLLGLSVDNVVAGTALSFAGLNLLVAAVVVGLISGLLALAGLRVGAAVSRRLTTRAEVLAGMLLLAVALSFLLFEG